MLFLLIIASNILFFASELKLIYCILNIINFFPEIISYKVISMFLM